MKKEICSKCGKTIPEESRACPDCYGKNLPDKFGNKTIISKHCTECGQKNKQNDKFCSSCGKDIKGLPANNKQNGKISLSRVGIGLLIAVGLSSLYGIASMILAGVLTNPITHQNSEGELFNKVFDAIFLGSFVILVILTAIYTFRKRSRRSVPVFMVVPIILIAVLLNSSSSNATPKPSQCRYSELNDKNIKSLISDYRLDNGKTLYTNNDKLDEYARHMTDSLIDKNKDDRLKDIYSEFSDFYYKGYDRNKDWPKRIKTTYAFYNDKVEDPCKVVESIKSDKVLNSQILENKYSFIGVGIKYTFVYVILAEEDTTPLPQQPQQVYIQQQAPRPIVVPQAPTIQRPKQTTCRWNSLLQQMTCTEY